MLQPRALGAVLFYGMLHGLMKDRPRTISPADLEVRALMTAVHTLARWKA